MYKVDLEMMLIAMGIPPYMYCDSAPHCVGGVNNTCRQIKKTNKT